VQITPGDGAQGDGRGDPLGHLENATGHSRGLGRSVLKNRFSEGGRRALRASSRAG